MVKKNTRLTDNSLRINLVRRKEKKKLCEKGGQKHILIDDYIKNVQMNLQRRWYRNTSHKLFSNTI